MFDRVAREADATRGIILACVSSFSHRRIPRHLQRRSPVSLLSLLFFSIPFRIHGDIPRILGHFLLPRLRGRSPASYFHRGKYLCRRSRARVFVASFLFIFSLVTLSLSCRPVLSHSRAILCRLRALRAFFFPRNSLDCFLYRSRFSRLRPCFFSPLTRAWTNTEIFATSGNNFSQI